MVRPPLFEIRGTPEFKTDGCSGYISWIWTDILGFKPFLRFCCEMHDFDYWEGKGSRLKADIKLTRCIVNNGFSKSKLLGVSCFFLGIVFFLGIRVGGSKYLPFSWRWGYKNPWPLLMW